MQIVDAHTHFFSFDFYRLMVAQKRNAKTLLAFGSGRIPFGTDSGVLPRGYRDDILQTQSDVCDALNLSGDEKENIFGRNAMKLYMLQNQK